MISNDFERYMHDFEQQQTNRVIDSFITDDNVNQLANYLSFSKVSLSSDQYKRITAKLMTGIEVVGYAEISIYNHLLDTESIECENYFKYVLENEIKDKFQYAIKYFSYSDISKNIKYLEKILTSFDKFENIFCDLYAKIAEFYLPGLHGNKSAKEIKEGREKLEVLLNSEVFVNRFSFEKICVRNLTPDNFLNNSFTVMPENLFIKETKLYKKYETYILDK